jgi:hypothetical protein
METHDSKSSFFEILLPFIISLALVFPFFHKIGFIKIDNKPEYVKSMRAWISAVAIGVLIRFVMNVALEPLFFFVIVGYSIATSGTIRIIHKQF